ncbi:MAG TPA: hypothetical protein IAB69_05625 [Candidatus Coproplasma excrementigallinarum]|uniref:Cyclophilin-like domain-containing protein n=1 Tax=Candidatus Coproplasma excrementigallinarum TaxID=2840747 RepID=A0A9D1SJ56_9FIRM|nr:hypothetical protein [Candidatus Coproplasma excrementigallinarum]
MRLIKLLAVCLAAACICTIASCAGGQTSENNPPHSGDISTPGGDTTTQGGDTTTPGEDATTPGEDTTTPDDDTVTPELPEENQDEENTVISMYIYINGNSLEAELAENSATQALVEILEERDIIYTARDYGGFEKVGDTGIDFPTQNERITTTVGDIMLYNGSQIVIFYGQNTWSYIRLGRIKGYSADSLRQLLGNGNKEVRLSLE